MSTAVYAYADGPADQDNAPPPARRPTGARLYRRMVSDAGNKPLLKNLRVLPYGCPQVLRSVANLVATSPDGESFEMRPDLCPGGIAEQVGIHEGVVGPLGDVEARLAALHRAGLIELGEHSVRLRLPPERETARRVPAEARIGLDGSRLPSGRIGRPRKGESPQAYRARQQDANAYAAQWHREQAELLSGQRPLPMPPVAVGSAVAAASDLPRDFPRDLNPTFGLSPISREVGIKSGLSADFPHAVGVVVKDSEKDSRDLTPTPPTARERDFSADLNKSAENKSVSEKSDLSAADLIAGEISPDLHQAAGQLRGMVARGLDLDPSATAKALPVILGWLKEEKVPPNVLLAEFSKGIEAHRRDRAVGGRGITSVNWFSRPVRTALQALRARDSPPYLRPEPASGSAARLASLDPSLAAVPAWASAAVEVQAQILWLLKTMARPPGRDRASRLRGIRSRSEAAFQLVAAVQPEILGMAEDESG